MDLALSNAFLIAVLEAESEDLASLVPAPATGSGVLLQPLME